MGGFTKEQAERYVGVIEADYGRLFSYSLVDDDGWILRLEYDHLRVDVRRVGKYTNEFKAYFILHAQHDLFTYLGGYDYLADAIRAGADYMKSRAESLTRESNYLYRCLED